MAGLHVNFIQQESIKHSSIKLFADDIDCILYKAIQTPEDANKIQEDLCALQDWQQKWLMKLNASKCFVMSVLHPRRSKIVSPYRIQSHVLSSVENYKYLGVTIQSDLKWHKHIQSITCKANQTLGLLKCNLQATPQLRERELTLHLYVPNLSMPPRCGTHT